MPKSSSGGSPERPWRARNSFRSDQSQLTEHQERPKRATERPKIVPRAPKRGPRGANRLPRVSPEASWRAQKRAQEQFKRESSIFANFEPRVGPSMVFRGWAPPGGNKHRLGGSILERKKPVDSQSVAQRGQNSDLRGSEDWNGLPRGCLGGEVPQTVPSELATRS